MLINIKYEMTYEKKLEKLRQEKDSFFKNHFHSPLTEEQRASFVNLNYYKPNILLKFQIELKQYQEQDKIDIMTSKGFVQKHIRYGYLEFEISSKNYRLTVFKQEDSDHLFVPFKDKTNGIETYGAGRYVELEHTSKDYYNLDFNTSYNPYCAYNDNWVCPLTPFENHLNVEIRAGERNFK